MNKKKQITQEVIENKKTSSRGFHKKKSSKNFCKPRRQLCIDDITEVLRGSSY